MGDERGLSLIELVVAIAVGSMIVLAVASLEILSLRSDNVDASRSASLESLRNAMDHAVEDLRFCTNPMALDVAGVALAVNLPGVGLQANCPAPAGVTRYTVAQGQLIRTNSVESRTVAETVDQVSFAVDPDGLISMMAQSTPISGRTIVVPVSVTARLSTHPPGAAPADPNQKMCGMDQPVFGAAGFYSDTSITTTSAPSSSFMGDVYANGGLSLTGTQVAGVGASSTPVVSGAAILLPSAPAPPVPKPDWNALRASAIDSHPGNWQPTGDINLGRDGVIWVGGNLSVNLQNNNPPIRVHGHVTIVVYGSAFLSSPLVPDDPAKDSIALIIHGDITIQPGNAYLTSLLYAEGTLYSPGPGATPNHPVITGVVVVGGVKDSAGLTWRQDNSVLTTPMPGMDKLCVP